MTDSQDLVRSLFLVALSFWSFMRGGWFEGHGNGFTLMPQPVPDYYWRRRDYRGARPRMKTALPRFRYPRSYHLRLRIARRKPYLFVNLTRGMQRAPVEEVLADYAHKLASVPAYHYGDAALETFCEGFDPRQLLSILKEDFRHTTRVKIRDKSEKRRLARALVAASNLFETGSPRGERRAYRSTDGDACPLIVDTGASTSVTPNREDFQHYEECKVKIHGLAHESTVLGRGIVRWRLRDALGADITIDTWAYHVPNADVRLFSPQAYFQKEGGSMSADHAAITLAGLKGATLTVPYHARSNLPMIFGVSLEPKSFLTFDCCAQRIALSVTDELNQNLTAAQKELLHKHHVFGHAHMQWCQT